MAAIPSSIVSRTVGYELLNRSFSTTTPTLPMRIAVLGEPNTANETAVATDLSPFEALSEDAIGKKFGYGSPIHLMWKGCLQYAKVPVFIYPQKYVTGGSAPTSTVKTTAIANAATANANHKIVIAGVEYSYPVVTGDTDATITAKIVSILNAVPSCPVIAIADVDDDLILTSKWKGLTSAGITLSFDTGGNAVGLTYTITTVAGTGTPDIDTALALFGSTWNTIVVNPYGTGVFADLSEFNGVPSTETPSGRWEPTILKPFLAVSGSIEASASNIAAITESGTSKAEVTNFVISAPNSPSLPFEIAADGALVVANIANETPKLGYGGIQLKKTIVPKDGLIGDFSTLEGRNSIMKKGCSTAIIENGKFVLQDVVTTYHPDGEEFPKFRFVRDVLIDMNIGFGWKIIMLRDILDKVIVGDNDSVEGEGTISPKQGKCLLSSYIDQNVSRGFIVDGQFSLDSRIFKIDEVSPTRFNIQFRYKRSSVCNQAATTAAVDFYLPNA